MQQQVTPALKEALGISEEPVPPRATSTGRRTTPSILGFGLLDAVPDEAILREATGRSSWESLSSAARFLHQRGIRDVVLVSDPFHAARIHGIAAELGLSSATSPTRTSPIRGLSEFRHMVTETAQVGVGRVIGFRRLVRVEHHFAFAQKEALPVARAIL